MCPARAVILCHPLPHKRGGRLQDAKKGDAQVLERRVAQAAAGAGGLRKRPWAFCRPGSTAAAAAESTEDSSEHAQGGCHAESNGANLAQVQGRCEGHRLQRGRRRAAGPRAGEHRSHETAADAERGHEEREGKVKVDKDVAIDECRGCGRREEDADEHEQREPGPHCCGRGWWAGGRRHPSADSDSTHFFSDIPTPGPAKLTECACDGANEPLQGGAGPSRGRGPQSGGAGPAAAATAARAVAWAAGAAGWRRRELAAAQQKWR